MLEIEYSSIDAAGIDIIEPLWNKLIVHHRERATRFRKHMESVDFAGRKSELLEKAKGGGMHIDLAYDAGTQKLVGYCVSTVDDRKQGEIDSIYVEDHYRCNGIAAALMKKALQWLDGMSVEKKVLLVASGNEEVLAFYEKLEFYPRGIVLEQVKDT